MTNVITSVSDYLEKLKKIAVDGDSQLFYRGVSNEEYATPENNIPSIYRNKGWIENEDKMFYELVSRAPEEFKDCQNTFEYLVKMQHYGYPTRLLDITSNPLVALYFACAGNEKENKKDGSIILFHIKKHDICNYASDRVALVSTLALINRNLNGNAFLFNELLEAIDKYEREIYTAKNDYELLFLYQQIIYFKEILPFCERIEGNISELIEYGTNIGTSALIIYLSLINIFSEIVNIYQKELKTLPLSVDSDPMKDSVLMSLKESVDKSINEILDVLGATSEYKSYTPIAKNIKEMKRIIEDKLLFLKVQVRKFNELCLFNEFENILLKSQQPIKTNLILEEDLKSIQNVIPKYDNPRVLAQQGAFLLFGFNKNSNKLLDKPIMEESTLINDLIQISIPSGDKKSILEELYRLGVSKSTLFPEVEHVTDEIKKRYIGKKK